MFNAYKEMLSSIESLTAARVVQKKSTDLRISRLPDFDIKDESSNEIKIGQSEDPAIRKSLLRECRVAGKCQFVYTFGCSITFTDHQERSSSMPKRTFQPNRRHRSKTHGFRTRMKTKSGQAVLSRRRAKGRHRLAVKAGFREK